jgi:ribosomal protein L11 methyltransferase
MRKSNQQEDTVVGPYEDLYIYYLKGRVAPNTDFYQPDFIGNWEEDGFSFLFYTRPSSDRIDAILNVQPQLTLIDAYHMTYTEWLGEKPTALSIGQFIIVPPWERNLRQTISTGNRLKLVLNPGVVFGTGTHVTTKDCLKAIESIYADLDPPHLTLDLGTGTGVLALAATALGSCQTLAVDFNFLAARTAAENIRLNRMENRILSIQGKAEQFIDLPADLLIANIHYDIMRLLLPTEGFRQKNWFVLSGLMRSQAVSVITLLIESGAHIIKRWEGDGVWHTILGKNP